LESPLEIICPNKCLDTVPGFPSYYTDSLLEMTTLKHSVGLTEYWTSRYFGRLSTNTAETGYG
ncbi:hypothetical protein, partial [Psychromonas arctica]